MKFIKRSKMCTLVYYLFKTFLQVLRKPEVLHILVRRQRHPFRWALKRIATEFEFATRQVDMLQFVAFLTKKEIEDVKRAYEEYRSSDDLRTKENNDVLYVLVRMVEPQVVVETGVASGYSSAALLSALHRNNKGELYSIDIGNLSAVPEGKSIGWMVPSALHYRWHLTIADARSELPILLQSLGKVNLFLHDSLHTEEHMMFEYETAWQFITRGGLLLSHDISLSFLKFSKRVNRPYRCFGLPGYGRYGGIVK